MREREGEKERERCVYDANHPGRSIFRQSFQFLVKTNVFVNYANANKKLTLC